MIRPLSFYLPENPEYTIFDSMRDSVRFTRERTLTTYRGHICSRSSFVDPEGRVMGWHDFGHLEGPGWAANAVGGAYELLRFARFTADAALEQTALSVLDHVLEDGFVREDGFIIGYRDTQRDELCLNFKHNSDWFCPGSMAKIAGQMLLCADLDEARRSRLHAVATGCAAWLAEHVLPAPNGWFPRRCTPEGHPYPRRAEGGEDPCFAVSGDGLLVLLLWTELTRRGLADYTVSLSERARRFVEAGGYFGSLNHDTYDLRENVSYAVAFRVLHRAARLLEDASLRRFAYEVALAGLDRFKMAEDRNGVATRGLLWMEESWDTAYLWENAEAALAYLEAFADTEEERYLRDALTILRASAKHHHGPYGFLTEGVDWNNHVGAQHHLDGAEFGDLQYTEPFLNNQHIVEPTLFYLETFAERRELAGEVEYRDFEGNVLLRSQRCQPSPLPNCKRS
ncbi:MAG TPA: hypothetical protein EYP85_03390 [Armatimonadetes bacterium]|nr:hypothetical protein [Armatimonadota bacterium]